MAANVAVAQDPAGYLMPARDKSTERIDGIVAAIMAIGRAMVAQEQPQPMHQVFWGVSGEGSRRRPDRKPLPARLILLPDRLLLGLSPTQFTARSGRAA